MSRGSWLFLAGGVHASNNDLSFLRQANREMQITINLRVSLRVDTELDSQNTETIE
jgi:hypothetical protein